MFLLNGLIGTLTGDKPSDWSNLDYALYKNLVESSKKDWDKAKRMGKERFGIDIKNAKPDQQIQLFGGFAKGFFKTTRLNEKECLPERFEPYCNFIEAEINKYGKIDITELLKEMCKRYTDEYVQAKKWR